jgi:membrane associated rhomboid family serine protease
MPIDRLYNLRNDSQPRRYRSSWGFSLSPILTIILVNLVLLIATLFSGKYYFTYNGEIVGEIYKLEYYLGLMPEIFWEHPWTIITNMFVHGGFWHLFANMITLYFLGTFLSRLVGNSKVLLVYFIGGIFGNVLYILLGDPLSIAVGASGAVYAVAGALVVLVPNVRVLLYFFIPMPLWVVVLVFFVLWSFMPNVAWEAHLGGLVVGLIAGYFFRRRWPRITYTVR